MSVDDPNVVSVNVALPRVVRAGKDPVLTAIYKSPEVGRVRLTGFNLAGDRQADLNAHGGRNKAVYLYPREHYAYWENELPTMDLPYGAFGENLTATGILEEEARIGDRYRIGTAILQVSQPRMPCFKLGIRFGSEDMPRRFWESGRTGIYFSVVEEGELGVGDRVERIELAAEAVTVADIVRLYRGRDRDPVILARAARAPLRGFWRKDIARWLHEDSGCRTSIFAASE